LIAVYRARNVWLVVQTGLYRTHGLELRGLRVMVSAGAGGIGLAIARAFVREGARVSVCDVDTAALRRWRAPTRRCMQCSATFRSATRWRAGSTPHWPVSTVSTAWSTTPASPARRQDRRPCPRGLGPCLAVCLTGQFNCLRLAVPALRSSGNASIVNVSSLAGRLGFALRTRMPPPSGA
jgi:NAD(P)-dependent dehydrogenase (short-subunit alcohol dehydrogenase family)